MSGMACCMVTTAADSCPEKSRRPQATVVSTASLTASVPTSGSTSSLTQRCRHEPKLPCRRWAVPMALQCLILCRPPGRTHHRCRSCQRRCQQRCSRCCPLWMQWFHHRRHRHEMALGATARPGKSLIGAAMRRTARPTAFLPWPAAAPTGRQRRRSRRVGRAAAAGVAATAAAAGWSRTSGRQVKLGVPLLWNLTVASIALPGLKVPTSAAL
mmetsp:Transcript_74063/g.192314  ORF Transcript_74063/g.192314 Transcript_74063/m.192314 type:complete len:213 (+) Transcript_74063:1426-2064(+)